MTAARTLLNLALCTTLVPLWGCSDETDSEGYISGIDVSYFQGTIDWSAVGQSNVAFTFIKVSEGLTIEDPQLKANWDGAHAAGLRRGGYHVFVPTDDGAAQAKYFLDTLHGIGADHNGALPPVLDIETNQSANSIEAIANMEKWLEAVEAEFHCKPIIYTNVSNFVGTPAHKKLFEYPLWIADYSQSPPRVPQGWKTWTFWQISDSSKMKGIASADLDSDRFKGGRLRLTLETCLGW